MNKMVTFRWSGDHKTIVDIGNKDSIVAMYLSIAISQQKEEFRQMVREGVPHSFLERTKYEIRSMQVLRDRIQNAYDIAIDDQREAAKAAYSMIMRWKED